MWDVVLNRGHVVFGGEFEFATWGHDFDGVWGFGLRLVREVVDACEDEDFGKVYL
jgi:hypothetical protein